MAALTATDWVVVVNPPSSTVSTAAGGGPQSRSQSGIRKNYCKLMLAIAGSYPTNGIPQPSAQAMGMGRNVSYISVLDRANLATASFADVKWDATNASFRVFTGTASIVGQSELATTVTVGTGGSFVLYCEVTGW